MVRAAWAVAGDLLAPDEQTIYRTLFIQARGALQKELLAHLRAGDPYNYVLHFPFCPVA